MKTIKLGMLPKNKWIGVTGICRNCGTEVEIEQPEEVTTYSDQRDGDSHTVTCPLCFKAIYVTKPN